MVVPETIKVRTEEEAESRAQAELQFYVGRLIRVDQVVAYFKDCNDYVLSFSEAVVRVRFTWPQQEDWNGEFLDPCWDVDIVEHPRKDEIEHAWIYGRAYKVVEDLNPLEELAQAVWAPDYREQS